MNSPCRKAKAARRRGESGHYVMESGLVLIPALVMMFGILDVSMVIFIQNTLASATRQAARWAITFSPTYDGNSCSSSQAACISSVVQNNSFGFMAGKSALITVNYYTANDLTNPADTCTAAGACTLNPNSQATASLPQTLANGVKVSYANQPGNVVEVKVTNYPWNWFFPVSATHYQLTATSTDLGASSLNVLGGLAPGVTTPPNP